MNKLTARTGADILAYALATFGDALDGTTSYVLISTRNGRASAALRVDAHPEAPKATATALLGYMAKDLQADGMLLAVISAKEITQGQGEHAAVIEQIIDLFDQAGRPVRDGWMVTPTHWRNLLCTEDCQCGDHAPKSLDEIRESPLAAGLAYSGYAAPAPITVPAHTPNELTAALLVATAPTGRDAGRAWAELLDQDQAIPTAELAAIIAAMTGGDTRDRIMARSITDDETRVADALQGAMQTRPLWERLEKATRILTTALPGIDPAHRPGVLTLLGWAEWLRGNGTRAMNWTEAALSVDHGYRLAHLLQELFNAGVVAPVAADESRAYSRR